MARAGPFKENFRLFALHHLCTTGGPGLRLAAGARVHGGLSGMAVLSTPHPEWGCGYCCSSRAAPGILLFAALCPQAARKALPCLASRPPGSVDERHSSHLWRLKCSVGRPGDVEASSQAPHSLLVDGGSLVSTLLLAFLQALASSDTVLGQPGWECPGPVLKDA